MNLPIPRHKRIHLREIRYKPSDLTNGVEFGLGGIQLVFTEGHETPLFETKPSENNFRITL